MNACFVPLYLIELIQVEGIDFEGIEKWMNDNIYSICWKNNIFKMSKISYSCKNY
jgi:hypothetical protein